MISCKSKNRPLQSNIELQGRVTSMVHPGGLSKPYGMMSNITRGSTLFVRSTSKTRAHCLNAALSFSDA